MSTETLTSLAMLKINIDEGRDYLNYLHPFFLQVLVDHKPDIITTSSVKQYILADFGLDIPEKTVQIVLKRLAKIYPLKKDHGVYKITNALPNPHIIERKAEAYRHIQAVIEGLINFSNKSSKPISNHNEAVQALCSFLQEFDVAFLKSFLRGTTIPSICEHKSTDIVLVSQYVLYLQKSDPGRFYSFQVLVQGHMLANALLCPDLNNLPKTYRSVVFYLDTPLLTRWLGLEGEYRKNAMEELVSLIRKLEGTFAVFEHTLQELYNVIVSASKNLNNPRARGAIIIEARRQGISRSDLILLAEKLHEKLKSLEVDIRPTPKYSALFQIDETAFENVLDDEVSYYNPKAKLNDINSVRSIYSLRYGHRPQSLEKAKAVLVTSNSAFAHAAFIYGEKFNESIEVSPVITDFSLANMAWLKSPIEAPLLPIIEVLSFSFAALELPNPMLIKFLAEVERLEKNGKISARDHQILRSSVLVHQELMHLTLGEDEALSDHSILETLERVKYEIKKEERDKYQKEAAAHKKTKDELISEHQKIIQIRKNLFRRCTKRAKHYSCGVSIFVTVLIVCGLLSGIGIKSNNPILGWILTIGLSLLLIFTLINLLLGTTVKTCYRKLFKYFLRLLLRREYSRIGLDVIDIK